MSQAADEGGAVRGKNPEEFVGQGGRRPRENPVRAPYYGRRRSQVTKRLKQDKARGWEDQGPDSAHK